MAAQGQAIEAAPTVLSLAGWPTSVLPYLVGLVAFVAMVITLLLIAYCLLHPIGARFSERDAFLDAKAIAAAQAKRQEYTVFGYRRRSRIPLFFQLLAALTFRRT